MEILAFLLAVAGQEIIGIAGGIGAGLGGVAWVYRVENDLVAKYRSRVAELQRELEEAEEERDQWRDKYYSLVHEAARHGVPLTDIGLPRRDRPTPSPPADPPPLVPPEP